MAILLAPAGTRLRRRRSAPIAVASRAMMSVAMAPGRGPVQAAVTGCPSSDLPSRGVIPVTLPEYRESCRLRSGRIPHSTLTATQPALLMVMPWVTDQSLAAVPTIGILLLSAGISSACLASDSAGVAPGIHPSLNPTTAASDADCSCLRWQDIRAALQATSDDDRARTLQDICPDPDRVNASGQPAADPGVGEVIRDSVNDGVAGSAPLLPVGAGGTCSRSRQLGRCTLNWAQPARMNTTTSVR